MALGGKQFADVETSWGMDRTLGVRDRVDLASGGGKQLGDVLAGIAKSLDRRSCSMLQFESVGFISHDVIGSACCRIVAPARAAKGDGFAGNHRWRPLADNGAVFVHHPRHDLFIGADIRRWNVPIWTNDRSESPDV